MSDALEDVRVLLTREREDSRRWGEALEEHGATVSILPCLRTLVRDEAEQDLRNALTHAQWLVFTSRRGVSATIELLGTSTVDHGIELAAVGPATAGEVERSFGRTALTPDVSTAASLAQRLEEVLLSDHTASSHNVVLAVADRAQTTIEDSLRGKNFDVTRVDVYETRPVARIVSRPPLDVDVVVLSSPSAVEGLVNQRRVPSEVRFVSIGPTTSSAIRSAGFNVCREASSPELCDIVSAIASAASASRS